MMARRMLAGVLVLLTVCLGVPLERALEARPAGLIRAVGAIGMTVGNVERSIAFYSDVLGFEKVSDVEVLGEDYERLQGIFGLRMHIVRMRLGGETIELTEYLTPRGRPIPVDSRSHDRWFQHIAIIVTDMDRAYAWLRQHQVEHASPAPQRLPDWNVNAGGIRAFYFKDPDGHPLEILWFPRGKGDPKWQRPSDRLFLGIDHTAIVVSDTARSLRCYRDTLGLRVAGESENYGPEQEPPEQRLWSAPPHHGTPGVRRPWRRVPRVLDSAGRAGSAPGRCSRQRSGPLADDFGQPGHRGGGARDSRQLVRDAVVRRCGPGRQSALVHEGAFASRPGRPRPSRGAAIASRRRTLWLRIGYSHSRRSSTRRRPIMAKVLRCGDLMPGCNAVIEGKDEAEVMAKGAEHAKTAHKMTAIPPEMAAKVRAAIKEKQ